MAQFEYRERSVDSECSVVRRSSLLAGGDANGRPPSAFCAPCGRAVGSPFMALNSVMLMGRSPFLTLYGVSNAAASGFFVAGLVAGAEAGSETPGKSCRPRLTIPEAISSTSNDVFFVAFPTPSPSSGTASPNTSNALSRAMSTTHFSSASSFSFSTSDVGAPSASSSGEAGSDSPTASTSPTKKVPALPAEWGVSPPSSSPSSTKRSVMQTSPTSMA